MECALAVEQKLSLHLGMHREKAHNSNRWTSRAVQLEMILNQFFSVRKQITPVDCNLNGENRGGIILDG
jgi:hypothetical protein